MATLLTRLRKETNGAVVEAMTARGIRYPLSYGVSVPAIREVCAAYAPNHALARLLFRQQVRELRLAGIFIADPAEVKAGELGSWAEGVINTEVGEHLAHALFGRSSVAETVLSEWLNVGTCTCGEGRGSGSGKYLPYTALLTGARALSLGEGDSWDFERIFSLLPALLSDGERTLWPASASFLDRVIGKVSGGREHVCGLLGVLERSGAACYPYLKEELGWQLEE